MRRFFGITGFGIVLVIVFALTAHAQPGRFALSGKAGTLGLGVEASIQMLPTVFGRVGINGFKYDYDGTAGNIGYDFDMKFFSVSTLADWHPFDGVFRITGGVLFNGNEVDARSRATSGLITVGNNVYDVNDVGTLRGKADFNKIAPYLGIGWSNAAKKDKRWGFFLDIGAMFQGSPKVDLTSDGPLSSDPAFRANLDREKEELKEKFDKFKLYPVVSFGVMFRF
jgi:hypothetical protein